MKREEITEFEELTGELAEADFLLEKYGRWSRDRIRRQRCASAERNYRAPKDDEERAPIIDLMSDFDAMNVHKAVIKVPRPYRDVLLSHYVKTSVPVGVSRRSLGMSWKQYATAKISGLRMFINIKRFNGC